MPIIDEQFKGGKQLDPKGVILDFLRFNSRYAYTRSEIEGELSLRGMGLKGEEVQRILTSMETGGRIESQTVDGVTYYKYFRIVGYKPIRRLG